MGAYFPDGRFFEDFSLGETIIHAVPRTLGDGDAAAYQALYGGRHVLHSAAPFAQSLGYKDRPLEDWLVFHIIFGKSVPDISRNAMANLGYAEGRFERPVFAGDTLSASSEVIGLRQNKSGETGLVMVRTTGCNQTGETVLSYVRWVMVKKRDVSAAAPDPVWPEPAAFVAADALPQPAADFAAWDKAAAGAPHGFDDMTVGAVISHGDGVTLEEAEHMQATRLYQNTAAVHFDALMQADSRFGKRLIYGGHMISHARAMSVNGLENAGPVLALNGGVHAAPAFAGDTVYGWTQVLDKAPLPGRSDCGALRLRHILAKNRRPADWAAPPVPDADGKLPPEAVLALDVWVLMPL